MCFILHLGNVVQSVKKDCFRFKSLDDIWYFGGQDEHLQEATMAHESQGKSFLDVQVGDVLGVAGNHWNGYNKGKNHRTGRVGLYPEYKTREVVKEVKDFPTYPHVKPTSS